MPSALRLIAPGLAANSETLVASGPLAIIIACMHCGGAKQVIQRLQLDWTTETCALYDAYYRKELPPCVCHVDEVRARSLLKDLDALREANLQLAQEKLDLERHIRTLFSLDTSEQEALKGTQ